MRYDGAPFLRVLFFLWFLEVEICWTSQGKARSCTAFLMKHIWWLSAHAAWLHKRTTLFCPKPFLKRPCLNRRTLCVVSDQVTLVHMYEQHCRLLTVTDLCHIHSSVSWSRCVVKATVVCPIPKTCGCRRIRSHSAVKQFNVLHLPNFQEGPND